jgi:hypothetical protein
MAVRKVENLAGTLASPWADHSDCASAARLADLTAVEWADLSVKLSVVCLAATSEHRRADHWAALTVAQWAALSVLLPKERVWAVLKVALSVGVWVAWRAAYLADRKVKTEAAE